MAETILVIEDEQPIRVLVRAYLEKEGYDVITADSGDTGLAQFNRAAPDLVILDLNLPQMDGLQIAQHIREKSDAFILMLTARAEEEDRVKGLKIGADDYLTKPFSPREMVARVDALLRRQRRLRQPVKRLESRHCAIDFDRHEATAGDSPLDLTPTEFKLLWILMQQPGHVRSRQELLDLVWGGEYYGNDRVVDVYIGQVRRKIEEACDLTLIETVRGVGYKFVDEAA